MGQINYVVSLMFIALFTVSIIGFGVNFANDNDAAIDISDDADLVSLNTQTTSQLDTIADSSEESYQSIVSSSVQQGETIESGGVFSLTITSVFPVVKNILDVGYSRIFGSGGDFGIFLTVFIAILGFLGFMYFVKTWLGRNPD